MKNIEEIIHAGCKQLAREMFKPNKCHICHGIGTVAFYPMYSNSSHTSVAERRPCTDCFGTGIRNH